MVEDHKGVRCFEILFWAEIGFGYFDESIWRIIRLRIARKREV